MASSEFAFVWKSVNLDNFKVRLDKCLHKNSVLFETGKLR